MLAKIPGVTLLTEPIDLMRMDHLVLGTAEGIKPRTLKALVAYSTTSNITGMDWVNKSMANGNVLPSEPFCIKFDDVMKLEHRFSISDTISNGVVARAAGGVLHDMSLYIHPDVMTCAGNLNKQDLHLVLKSAGGTIISAQQLPKANNNTAIRNTIIIVPQKGAPLNASSAKAVSVGVKTMPYNDLINTIVNQRLEIPASTLVEGKCNVVVLHTFNQSLTIPPFFQLNTDTHTMLPVNTPRLSSKPSTTNAAAGVPFDPKPSSAKSRQCEDVNSRKQTPAEFNYKSSHDTFGQPKGGNTTAKKQILSPRSKGLEKIFKIMHKKPQSVSCCCRGWIDLISRETNNFFILKCALPRPRPNQRRR